jgi:hypothetical protein
MTMIVALIAVWLGQEPPPLNQKVLEFARERLGQKVGDGECFALAFEALRHAGARRPTPGPVWGEPIDDVAEALPGDIVQFRDAEFVIRRTVGRRTTIRSRSFPKHTAIVAAVKRTKGAVVLTVLHQNVGIDGEDEAARKTVREWGLDMADLKSGTVTVYRPLAEGR